VPADIKAMDGVTIENLTAANKGLPNIAGAVGYQSVCK
jgi:hypothetical protein